MSLLLDPENDCQADCPSQIKMREAYHRRLLPITVGRLIAYYVLVHGANVRISVANLDLRKASVLLIPYTYKVAIF